VRCISRGNNNRARVSWCATSGYETVVVRAQPRGWWQAWQAALAAV
jgi:hypothetical protein